MDDLIVEQARIEDYENILELYNELHEMLEECNPRKFRKISKDEILFTNDYFQKALLHEINTNFKICKINGKTVGIIEYAIWDAYQNIGYVPCTICVIGNIVLKKEYRNQGIGSHLFEYIKTVICPEFKVQRIELDMEFRNSEALQFYKKLGLIEDRIRFSIDV